MIFEVIDQVAATMAIQGREIYHLSGRFPHKVEVVEVKSLAPLNPACPRQQNMTNQGAVVRLPDHKFVLIFAMNR